MQVYAIKQGDPDAPCRVTMGICTLGTMRAERAMIEGLGSTPLGQSRMKVYVIGATVFDARNLCALIAQQVESEYLCFWDDDVLPITYEDRTRGDFGALERLQTTMDLNSQIDILGGVIPARQHVSVPIVLKERFGGPWWGWEDGKVHRVWMTTTGLTIYRMASLAKLDVPDLPLGTGDDGSDWRCKRYFDTDKPPSGTDDIRLADLAEKAGLTWYVHGRVIADQIEADGRRYRLMDAKSEVVDG